MVLALAQAKEAALLGEVPVGAVVVRHGVVIASGCNSMIGAHDPTAHAEIVALRAAALFLGNYRLEECEMFVTLEPCAMCSGALLNARLKRVVYGASEPKTGAAGSVLNLFAHGQLNHHTEVQGGVLPIQGRELLQQFFRQRRRDLREDALHNHLLRDDALRTPDADFEGLPGYPWTAHYVNDLESLDGLRMHYLDEGGVCKAQTNNSLTYLCLHGATGWSYEFRLQIPALLEAGHRVVAPDLIGFGKSDKPKKESFHTIEHHRQILVELVDRLDLSNIVLVVSEGSDWLGLTLPMAAPERFRYLTVLEGGLIDRNLPLSAGYLLWKNALSKSHLSFDEEASRICDVKPVGDEETRAFEVPFPDKGHRAALPAFRRIMMDVKARAGSSVSAEASHFWRHQVTSA